MIKEQAALNTRDLISFADELAMLWSMNANDIFLALKDRNILELLRAVGNSFETFKSTTYMMDKLKRKAKQNETARVEERFDD